MPLLLVSYNSLRPIPNVASYAILRIQSKAMILFGALMNWWGQSRQDVIRITGKKLLAQL